MVGEKSDTGQEPPMWFP